MLEYAYEFFLLVVMQAGVSKGSLVFRYWRIFYSSEWPDVFTFFRFRQVCKLSWLYLGQCIFPDILSVEVRGRVRRTEF